MYSFFGQICSFSISEVQVYTGNHDTLMTNKWFSKKTTNTWVICLFSTDEEIRKTKLTKTPKAWHASTTCTVFSKCKFSRQTLCTVGSEFVGDINVITASSSTCSKQ